MIFAPFVQRNIYNPRPSDVALQRFLRASLQAGAAPHPGVQVTHNEQATLLHIDVPGLAREQLQVHIEEQRVHVKSTEGAPRQLHRAWELPEPIDAAASSAKLENGVLTLTLAKRAPAPQAVELTVH